MIIRPATLADAAMLAAFGEKTFFDTFGHLYPQSDAQTFTAQRFSVERTCADISEADRYIQLAFVNDELAGFLDCGPVGLPVETPSTHDLELYRLYVDASSKGKGLAQNLMQMALDWAKTAGAASLYLGVYHDNSRAQAFYRKHGFEIIGAYQFTVGNTLDDERIMELKLG
jgi:diamine N-acetyltransferase